MNSDCQKEIVVITGATAGVGRATARAFARRGASIGLLARGEQGLEGAREEVEALGGSALALPTDVSDPAQVEAAAEKVEELFGPIDIWVNNAMTSVFGPFKEIEPEEFKRVTEVTYLGAVYGTMTALKRMLPRDHGTIVQVGSALSKRSIPLQSAYCGAKHGIIGFTDSVRTELIHDQSQVHVTVVQMPALNTPQFSWVRSRLNRKAQPVPPIFQPETAAAAIYWAAHNRRREVFLGLSTCKAIWGQKVAPGLLDKYLGSTGYSAQQIDEPEDPNRPDNLFEPVEGDFGAHGAFDNKAGRHNAQLWMSKHGRWAVGGLLALAAIGALGWGTRKKVR